MKRIDEDWIRVRWKRVVALAHRLRDFSYTGTDEVLESEVVAPEVFAEVFEGLIKFSENGRARAIRQIAKALDDFRDKKPKHSLSLAWSIIDFETNAEHRASALFDAVMYPVLGSTRYIGEEVWRELK